MFRAILVFRLKKLIFFKLIGRDSRPYHPIICWATNKWEEGYKYERRRWTTLGIRRRIEFFRLAISQTQVWCDCPGKQTSHLGGSVRLNLQLTPFLYIWLYLLKPIKNLRKIDFFKTYCSLTSDNQQLVNSTTTTTSQLLSTSQQ